MYHNPKRKEKMTDDRSSTPFPDDTPLDKAVPKNSKFLSKEDVDPPLLVQIFQMTTDQVEGDHGIEDRAVLYFHGNVKPLILNNTNKELLKAITGATTTGGVKNHQIILYNDATIMFRGKMTGGIRIRAATQPAPVTAPQAQPIQPAVTYPATDAPFDDSIPY
jgi:hypothetical protein